MKLTQATTLLLSLGLSLPVDGFTRHRTDAVTPKPPFRPLPASPSRSKTCHVKTNGDGTDDSDYILSALKKCNNGGKVVFDEDKEYTIGTALDMTFLKHVDLGSYTLRPPVLLNHTSATH
jgi:galacturan 1,4-alpha-galacturonidase